MKRLLLLICTLLCANVLSAQTRFWVGDLRYEVIPTNPTKVKVYYANQSITIANIPETVTYNETTYRVISIFDYAFKNCSSLTSVTIPNSVNSIGDYAFALCSSLTSITIPNSVTYIGWNAFEDCSSLTSITIPNSVIAIFDYAFKNCSGLTSVTIPNSVTSIGKWAFKDCDGLTTVTIPNSVTYIGKSAFHGCDGLTSFTIPNNVTSIEESVFAYCDGLASVTIPNSVTYIGESAFAYCDGLTSITIPNSVTSIGWTAFKNCSSLTSVTCLAVNPPTLSYNVFYNTPNEKSLIVPCGALDNYINSDWNDYFANIIEEIDFTITANVNNSAFGSVSVESDCSTSTATLTATENEGYQFVSWNDGNTDNPRTVALTSDTSFTAIFALIDNSSLSEDAEFADLSVYPNPTSGKVTFSQAIEKIEVIDLSGKTLQTYENANEINIEALPAGVYHLRMTIEDKTTTRKIIKE